MSETPLAQKNRNNVGWTLAAGLCLALIVYLAVGAYGASRWMTPRRNPVFVATPAAFHLDYKDVEIPSRDSDVKLSGWWIPRPGSHKAIVMVPGRGENRTTEFDNHFLNLAAALNTYQSGGFNVLMIDLRAHGRSGGKYSGWGVGERRDVEGAVDWIIQQGFHTGSIGALGASLGATSCVHAVAEDSDISALVVDGAGVDDYVNIKKSWHRVTGTPSVFLPAGVLMQKVLYGYDMRTLRPVDVMRHIAQPVLLIYGLLELPADDTVRRQQLASALPASELWVVPGARHTGSYTMLPQPYLQKVGGFFEQNLE